MPKCLAGMLFTHKIATLCKIYVVAAVKIIELAVDPFNLQTIHFVL